MLNSARFLRAFAAIEQELRRRVDVPKYVSFSRLVDDAAPKMPEVRRYRADLKEFADLRNAIVHESSDEHVLAEPNDRAVAEIEGLKALILSPPKIFPTFRRRVCTVESTDPVSAAVRLMTDNSYSQLPVLARGVFRDLLTANTVARWLGTVADEDLVSLHQTTVDAVLQYREQWQGYEFVSKGATVAAVVELFDAYERGGRELVAVMITETGARREGLLGIVTVSDLPRLFSCLR